MITAAALIASINSSLSAQRPTPAECQGALAALAVPNRDMAGWERVAECGPAAGQALGTALTNARVETDGTYLANLWTAAAAIRDPNVLNAAVAIARDRSAGQAARVVALVVALAQCFRGVGVLGWEFDRLTTVRWRSNCAFMVSTHQLPGSTNPMPANYVQALASLYDEVGWSPGENPVLADIAKCARVILRRDVPELVDPSLITLSYICGTKYRVSNALLKGVMATYRVVRGEESGDLVVSPNGSRDFFTVLPYAIQLEYNHRVIREAQNAGTPCPR